MGAGCADNEGVSIGLGLRDEIGGDVAARARLVLDDELLAVFFRKFLRNQTSENIGGSAGGERHDELDRAVRPGGGL